MTADRPLVVVSQRLGPLTDEERRIETAGAEVRSVPLWTHQEIATGGAGARVVVLGAVEPFDATALDTLDGCVAVVRRGVGCDNIDLDGATARGILVANVPDASVEEVSDHALALLLGIERGLVRLDRAVRQGMWRRDATEIVAVRKGMRRLGELTLGIVGFGRIGRALAGKTRSLYARVVVADPVVDDATATGHGAELVGLDELLTAADHLSLHAPLTEATRNLVDAAAIERMPPGAVVVNTARGGLVDERAVREAVATGRLGGAGLDVTATEPIEPGDPLLEATGVVLTAHSAASSRTAGAELARRSVDAVIDVLAGRLPDSVANPEVLDSPRRRLQPGIARG